jgi:hypothetical protein
MSLQRADMADRRPMHSSRERNRDRRDVITTLDTLRSSQKQKENDAGLTQLSSEAASSNPTLLRF